MGNVKLHLLSYAAPIQPPFGAPIYTAVSPYIPGAVSHTSTGNCQFTFPPYNQHENPFTEATPDFQLLL